MNELKKNTIEMKRFYLFAGIAMFIVVVMTLTDIVFGTMTSGFETVPETAIGRFAEFEQTVVMGLYHLDLLNVMINSLSAIGFLGLLLAHRNERPLMAGFAALLFIAGLLIFLSNNTALPMMMLANHYNASTDAAYRAALTGAGEAMLARGEHGSPGMFTGMFFMVVAGILISWQMLKGSIFKSWVAIIGIISNISLLIYLILMAFVPSSESFSMMIAAPGGLLSIVWQVVVARKFFLMAGKEEK